METQVAHEAVHFHRAFVRAQSFQCGGCDLGAQHIGLGAGEEVQASQHIRAWVIDITAPIRGKIV